MYTYVCILYVYIIYKRTTLERTTLKRTTLKRTTLEIHNVYNQYTIYIICKVLALKPLIQLKHAVALSFFSIFRFSTLELVEIDPNAAADPTQARSRALVFTKSCVSSR